MKTSLLSVYGVAFGLLAASSAPALSHRQNIYSFPSRLPSGALSFPAKPTTVVDPVVEPVKDDTAALRAEADRLRTQLEDVLNWILANFRGRFPVPESMLSRMDMPLLQDGDALHPDLVTLFRLGTQEVQVVEAAVQAAKTEIEALHDAIALATAQSTSEGTVSIPPHEEEAAPIRAQLMADLEVALGRDRLERFLAVAGKDLDRRFLYFGAAVRIIRFELLSDDEGGGLRIRDEVVTADDTGRRKIEAVEFESAEMPRAYAPYFLHLGL